MQKLINRFAASIPTTQTNVALQILRTAQQQGTIRTQDEYNKALQAFMANSSAYNPQPLLVIKPLRVDQFASSADFNLMLKFIEGDLTAIFNEIESLSELITAHREIFLGSSYNDLLKAMDIVNQEVAAIESQGSNKNKKTMANTFLDSRQLSKTADSVTLVQLDYGDPKTQLVY